MMICRSLLTFYPGCLRPDRDIKKGSKWATKRTRVGKIPNNLTWPIKACASPARFSITTIANYIGRTSRLVSRVGPEFESLRGHSKSFQEQPEAFFIIFCFLWHPSVGRASRHIVLRIVIQQAECLHGYRPNQHVYCPKQRAYKIFLNYDNDWVTFEGIKAIPWHFFIKKVPLIVWNWLNLFCSFLL